MQKEIDRLKEENEDLSSYSERLEMMLDYYKQQQEYGSRTQDELESTVKYLESEVELVSAPNRVSWLVYILFSFFCSYFLHWNIKGWYSKGFEAYFDVLFIKPLSFCLISLVPLFADWFIRRFFLKGLSDKPITVREQISFWAIWLVVLIVFYALLLWRIG